MPGFHPSVERPNATRVKRRRWLRVRRGVVLLAAAVSLYLLLPSLVSVFSSWRSLAHLDWYWAGVAVVAETASFISLWELNRTALRVSDWFSVACAQLSGNAFGRIVPGGGAAAGAFQVGILRRAGIPAARSATALAASTAMQIGTTLALPVLALPAIIGGAPVNHTLVNAAYLGVALLLLLLLGGIVLFAFDAPLDLAGRVIEACVKRIRHTQTPSRTLSTRLISERDSIRATLGERWWLATAGAAGNAGFDYAALICALRAVGAQPRPSLVLLAYTAAALLALVPLTPGGLGFVEAGLLGTLTLAGVNPADAVLAALVYRLVSFWLPIPIGGAAYLLFRRRHRTSTSPH